MLVDQIYIILLAAFCYKLYKSRVVDQWCWQSGSCTKYMQRLCRCWPAVGWKSTKVYWSKEGLNKLWAVSRRWSVAAWQRGETFAWADWSSDQDWQDTASNSLTNLKQRWHHPPPPPPPWVSWSLDNSNTHQLYSVFVPCQSQIDTSIIIKENSFESGLLFSLSSSSTLYTSGSNQQIGASGLLILTAYSACKHDAHTFIYLQMHAYLQNIRRPNQPLIWRLMFRLCFTRQGVLAIPADICGHLTIVAALEHVLCCIEVYKRNHWIQKSRRTCVAIKRVWLLDSCPEGQERFCIGSLGSPGQKSARHPWLANSNFISYSLLAPRLSSWILPGVHSMGLSAQTVCWIKLRPCQPTWKPEGCSSLLCQWNLNFPPSCNCTAKKTKAIEFYFCRYRSLLHF